MMSRLFPGLALSVCLMVGGLAASEAALLLTDGGQPRASIVVAPDATRAARLAAHELQYHLQLLTEATLPLVTAEVAPPGTRLVVGDSATARALGVTSAGYGPQEYSVTFLPDAVVLLGKDADDRAAFDYANLTTFPDRFTDLGTLYAVYDFLERYCGVRWYLPTDLGIAFTPTPTLRVSGRNLRRAPVVRYRDLPTAYSITSDLCVETVKEAWPPTRKALDWREQYLWAFRQRWGGVPYHANHSLMFPDEYAAHPDWFAQGYAEQMEKNPAYFLKDKSGKPVPPQLCYSNPEVLAYVVQQVRDNLDGKAKSMRLAGNCVPLVPADGGRFCQCPACTAQKSTDPAVLGNKLWLSGTYSDYVWRFVNKVAAEVRKTHPDTLMGALAYEQYAYPPSFDLEPNILPMFTLNIRLSPDPVQEAHEWGLLEQWSKRMQGRPFYVWLYYNFPADNARWGNYRCFPGFAAHRTGRYVKRLIDRGVRGIFIEPAAPTPWARDVLFGQLDEYVTWKLADDPTLDPDQLIDEFFVRFYGAAAKPMQELYEKMEEAFCSPDTYRGEQLVLNIVDNLAGDLPALTPATLRAVGLTNTQLIGQDAWKDRRCGWDNLRVEAFSPRGGRGDVLLAEAFEDWPGQWRSDPGFEITTEGQRTYLTLPWNLKGGTAIRPFALPPGPNDAVRLTFEHMAGGYDFYRSWRVFLSNSADPQAVTGYAITYERDGWRGKPYLDLLKIQGGAPNTNQGMVFKLFGNEKPASGWTPIATHEGTPTSLQRNQYVTPSDWTGFRLELIPQGAGTRLKLYMRTADREFTQPLGHQSEEIAWGILGTNERMTEWEQLLQRAKAAAKTDLEQRRVALFEAGVWQYMLAGKAAYGGDREIVR